MDKYITKDLIIYIYITCCKYFINFINVTLMDPRTVSLLSFKLLSLFCGIMTMEIGEPLHTQNVCNYAINSIPSKVRFVKKVSQYPVQCHSL